MLPTLNNSITHNAKATKYHYGVICIWLIFTIFTASYFIRDRLTLFDPQEKLTNLTQRILVKNILEELNLPKHLPNTLINIIDEGCRCNRISRDHLADVKRNAINNNMTVINITLPARFNGIIPSTPSVLALDHNSALIYFGPYSEGLACGKGEGIIDLVLSNYKKGFNAQLIMANSEGCYCNTL